MNFDVPIAAALSGGATGAPLKAANVSSVRAV